MSKPFIRAWREGSPGSIAQLLGPAGVGVFGETLGLPVQPENSEGTKMNFSTCYRNVGIAAVSATEDIA